MRDSNRLRRLAARVARNRAIDWDAEERAAPTDDERDAVRQLRYLAAMVGFNRAVQAGDTSERLAVSVSMARSVADPEQLAPAIDAPAPPELPANSRWGHLEILERVGRGAFGEVYRARDTRLDRIVALKLLNRETALSPDEVVREARLLAKVRHPHVVTVYGADRIDGRVGIWMEFLRGETLDSIVRTRGMLDAREAALIGIDVCRALSAVHAAGIVHQDVKLANVMRADGGRIVLMDLGLGREARPHAAGGKARAISGTPLFMAPEVLRGSAADARSDVYSLGVVLFSLVTGSFPVRGSSVSDLVAKHNRSEAQRARDLRADLPEGFARVLDRALASDADQRFATPGEIESALLHFLGAAVQSESRRERSVVVPRWAFATLGIAFVAATLFALWTWQRTRPGPQAPRTLPLAATPTASLLGETPGAFFGLTVAGVGDLDQDGFDDVLVAAPHHGGTSNRGKIYLYRGNSTGIEARPSWTAEGAADNDVFGWSLASSKSILRGGSAAPIVGAPCLIGNTGTGRVFVYAASKDGPFDRPVQTLSADRPSTSFGCAIATGDVNHDGADDLLVGEPYFPNPTARNGRALLYLASADSLATQPAWTVMGPPSSCFGIAVSLGGDVNHDGYADAVIGAPLADFGPDLLDCGAAYVFLGSSTGLDSIAAVLVGRRAGDCFGRDCHIVRDLDADGFSDVIVGAEYGTNGEHQEGIVQVFFGSKSGVAPYGDVLLESNNMGANFGGHAGNLGDLDGDGCDDLFVGALRYQRTEPREGAAFVFAGSRDRRLACAWLRVFGKNGSWYGAAGTSAGDVNGDGFPDFIVAAPSWDSETGQNVGQVEIFLNTRR